VIDESVALSLVREQLGDLAAKPTLTVDEVGSVLGLGKSATYEAIRRGVVPSLRFGRRVVVPTAGLVRVLAGVADV